MVLMNLLIAMLNFSYQKIKEEKDMAWKYIVSEIVYNYSSAPLIPPPLNLIVFVPTFLARALHDANQKKAGYDIYSAIPRSYEADSVALNESRARKRRTIVQKFFRKRKRAATKERMRQEMEEKELSKFSAKNLDPFLHEHLDDDEDAE